VTTVTTISLIPFFLIGLLGSVHCIGMCGGIVSAFTVASPQRKPFPATVVTHVAHAADMSGSAALGAAMHAVSYNAGRIGSYAIAGGIAGGVVGSARFLSGVSGIQVGGYWLANLALVALGLYLMGAWSGLVRLEEMGQKIWRRLQPLTAVLLPIDSPLKAFALGSLWGWLPCGMVYGVLLTAMTTGSAYSGAAVMLAFGLGTLPTLVTMGVIGSQLRTWSRRGAVRVFSGVIVLLFGMLGLIRAASGVHLGWIESLCLSPVPSEVHP